MKLLNRNGSKWHDDFTWESDSLAVIACDGKGNGCVLWYGGGASLRYEIEELGMCCLSDLGLDDAPHGISVWVGRFIAEPIGNYDCPDVCTEPHGKFRQPHESEWAKIRMNKNPFED